LISSGGRELTTGIFVEDILRLHPRLLLTAAVRFDKWTNYHGFLSNKPVVAAIETRSDFFDRRETAISPQASVLFRATPNLSFQASGYRGFRQPTLNELYRSFRVGDVLTLANENLRAERLAGGEAGMTIVFPSRSVRVRGSFYWTKISDPIANATLSISPSLITRQRQNLGSTRSRGFEIEAETQLSKHLKLSGGYLFVDARVLSFPNNPAVEGLLLPQVPRHQMTMQLLYTNARLLDLGVQMRGAGLQFDDDLNRLPLERYFQFDARVSRPLSPALKVFVAAENLFNSRYAIGRTPVLTVGPPALVRVGIKLHVPVLQ
jgi:outer membrane receptor protein involved in Fe transport